MWIGHSIEIASLILFAWCWVQSRGPYQRLKTELWVAVLYGVVLELLDMLIFGSYHYGPVTWWWIGAVPVYIPLLWALIVHASMEISDRSGLPMWARPWLDGLLAVLIDLSVDAVAIRVGLWHWSIPLDQGWFGVPAGNLCAWMWVAYWYSAMTRLVRDRVERQRDPAWHQWLIPIFAYTGLFGSMMTVGLLGRWVGLLHPDERLWIFVLQLAVFIAIVWFGHRRAASAKTQGAIPSSLIITRWLIHGTFLLLLLGSGMWRTSPWLIAVSLGCLVLEWVIQRWWLKPA